MKEIHVTNGPHIRSAISTDKIMHRLFLALLPIALFAFFKNGILPYLKGYTDVYGMCYPLLLMVISVATSYLAEWLCNVIRRKSKLFRKHSYSIFPGLFLALILPVNTPLWLMALGSLFATLIGKVVFGGFGNNIFNPALLGRLFVISVYAIVLSNHGGYLNAMEVDTIGGATPLSRVVLTEGLGSYETLVKPFGSLLQFLLGFIPGTLGETSAILCILAFIYLTATKSIKWKIPVFYVGTVFVMTALIGNYNDFGIWYPFFQVFSGGLLFGAVFMATDPVTSPTTPIGQILYGFFLGILTVIFRFLTPFPEGVLTSILTMNLFVFLLDKLGAKARFQISLALPYFGIAFGLMVILSVGIGMKYELKAGTNEKDPSINVVDKNFQILTKVKEVGKMVYTVTQQGYTGLIKAQITIQNGNIVEVNILEQQESFYQKIENANYIETLIQRQELLEEVDTVSGATITSNALKKMLLNTLQDYQKGEGNE